MHRIQSGTLGIVGLVLLFGSGLSWAGPPDPTPSDALGNTAGGTYALYNNTGYYNTAFGLGALFSNTYAVGNTASGFYALFSNNGDGNTASGFAALVYNTTGGDNTASGLGALYSNTTGGSNTASGFEALYSKRHLKCGARFISAFPFSNRPSKLWPQRHRASRYPGPMGSLRG